MGTIAMKDTCVILRHSQIENLGMKSTKVTTSGEALEVFLFDEALLTTPLLRYLLNSQL